MGKKHLSQLKAVEKLKLKSENIFSNFENFAAAFDGCLPALNGKVFYSNREWQQVGRKACIQHLSFF
jgi:hypothetical protein